jgi:hypothetical protein
VIRPNLKFNYFLSPLSPVSPLCPLSPLAFLSSCPRYNYHGSESLYSGLSGVQMQADIFIGVVYYQRLGHRVSGQSQVRKKERYNQ